MDTKITSFDKTFLSFLLRQLIAYDRDRMRITVTKLGEVMEKMPTKCEENLYRKQYGNLKGALNTDAVQAAFTVSGPLIQFRDEETITALHESGAFSEEDYKLYAETLEHSKEYKKKYG